MNHIGLFEGIGGFSLAAKWMNWETIAWCEWNEFCQKVLSYHFPNAKKHGNIIQTDFTIYRGKCDILTGGFPCQPNSRAGKQKFQEDERHLWPEMFRAYREIMPTWGVGENVPGIVDNEFSIREIQSNLESIGYNVLPIKIPANIVGAGHKRERIWFIAYASGGRQQGGKQRVFKAHEERYDEKNLLARGIFPSEWGNGLSRPRIFRDNDGLSKRLVNITLPKWRTESIKSYGNAIVPQVAYKIFKTIELLNDGVINVQNEDK